MSNTRLLSAAKQLPHFGYRVCFIGDSLIENGVTKSYSGTPDVTGTLQFLSKVYGNWVNWLECLSFGAIQCPVWADPTTTYNAGWLSSGFMRGFWGMNCGINGQTSDQILARLNGSISPCIITDMKFDMAFLEGGTNDLSANMDPEATIANMIAALDLLLNAGKIVFFLPIRARSLSSWGAGSHYRQKARYINQKLREACRARPNVYYIDWDRAWSDSTTADGEPLTNYTFDGVHDNPLGGYAIAKYMWFGKVGSIQVWQGLQAFFPVQEQLATVREDIYDATYNPFGNLLTNGTLVGTGGTATAGNGATGTVADNCTLERSGASGSTTVVGSKVTPADNSGFQQISTFTNGGVASETFYIPRQTTTTISVTALQGKWIQGWCDVEVSAAYDKISGIQNYIQEVQPNIVYRGGVAHPNGGFWPNETWKGRIYTPCILIGNTTTQIRPRIECVLTGGGAGNPVVKVSRWDVRQIVDPRIAYNWAGGVYGP